MRLFALIAVICLWCHTIGRADDRACAPGTHHPYREVAYRMIRADEVIRRGDVLTRLDEISAGDRDAFRDLVTEMRDSESPVRGRGVHEHVMASVLANGRTADAAYDARIPITATDGVIEFMDSTLQRMNPLGEETIWSGPEFEESRRAFANARENLLSRIQAARRQGWISYDDYLRLGVEYSIVSTLSVRRSSLTPEQAAGFRAAGLPGHWTSMSSAVRPTMDAIAERLPHDVVAWTATPQGREGPSELEIGVPASHIMLGELTAGPATADLILRLPHQYLAHDFFHIKQMAQAYPDPEINLTQRLQEFRRWRAFYRRIHTLRATDRDLHDALVRIIPYRRYHEGGRDPYLAHELYNDVYQAPGLTREVQQRVYLFLEQNFPVERILGDTSCPSCRLDRTQPLNIDALYDTVRADMNARHRSADDTPNIGYTLTTALDRVRLAIRALPESQRTWGTLTEFARGDRSLPELGSLHRRALREFLEGQNISVERSATPARRSVDVSQVSSPFQQDVLRDLSRVPARERQAFRELIQEMRAHEPPIRGLGIYERVMHSLISRGRSLEPALQTRIPISATEGVLDFISNALPSLHPFGPETLFAGPEFQTSRAAYTGLSESITTRIQTFRRQGYLTYEQYLDLGADFAALAHVSSRLEDVPHHKRQQERRRMLNPEDEYYTPESARAGMRRRTDQLLPGYVPVWTTLRSGETQISEADIGVPASHIIPGELVARPTEADSQTMLPFAYTAHDTGGHGLGIIQRTRPDTRIDVADRRDEFRRWRALRQRIDAVSDARQRSVLLRVTSFARYHEAGELPFIAENIYAEIIRDQTLSDADRQQAYRWVEQTFPDGSIIGSTECPRCRTISEIQQALEILRTRGRAALESTPMNYRWITQAINPQITHPNLPAGRQQGQTLSRAIDAIEFRTPMPERTWGRLIAIARGEHPAPYLGRMHIRALREFLERLGLMSGRVSGSRDKLRSSLVFEIVFHNVPGQLMRKLKGLN